MNAQRDPAGVGDLQQHRDRVLIERIGAGDEDAFSELFGRYGPASLGLALRVAGDKPLAEEVVQEVFVSVWRRPGAYDESRGSVRAWLLTQIHHRSVDVVRREEGERRRSGAILVGDVHEPQQDVIEEQWLATRRVHVRAALQALPPDQRAVIDLSYFGGLTQAEVASKLDLPLGTVKSRTTAAMRRLRNALRGER